MHHNRLPSFKFSIQPQGMTLIEVLVASTILFSFLAVMTQVMGTAAIASTQAEKNVTVSLHMPFIVDEINIDINQGRFSANGSLSASGITYQWRAIQKKHHEILKPSLEHEVKTRYVSLYNVELTTEYKGLQKTFNYVEVFSEK